MVTLWIFIVLWVIIPCHSLGLLHRCPLKENLPDNCSCEKNRNVLITCEGIKNTHAYQKAVRSFGRHVIDEFITKDTGPLEIISGPFKKLCIHSVTFDQVQFTTLPILVFLDGLEESLEELSFINSKVVSWVWERGTHFSFLKILRFDKTPLPNTITKSMLSVLPRKIRHLQMTFCGIRAFGEHSLRRFGLLEKLELEGNQFVTIARTVLPLPARRLKYISLTNNPMTVLPHDIFSHMRRLEFLSLAATQLRSLSQKTFEPVWEQLEEIYLNNIHLKCDCKIAWLLNSTENKIYKSPTCKETQKLLTDSNFNELCP